MPESRFGSNARNADSLATYCRDCYRVIERDYRRRRAAARGLQLRETRPLSPAGTKWCPDCQADVDLSVFVKNRGTHDGYGGYCRPHQNARARNSVEKNHVNTRHHHLRRRYGIGAADVAAMVAQQGGACPICVRPLGQRHHVDHDHVTGEVRAVLCFTCNGGLGNYGDDAVRLRRAAAYLDGTLGAPSRVAPGVYEVDGRSWRRGSAAGIGR